MVTPARGVAGRGLIHQRGGSMGFFSRLFKFREQDPDSQETTWAYEDNASELVLDPEYAATLMTEFDIDAAILSHEDLQLRLQRLVEGRADEVLDPVAVGQHEMVHPPHVRAAVPQAGCNTRPQHGHDDHVLVTDEILTRKYLHSVVLEMMVQVEKGCFPRLSAARFEILQR